MLLRATHCYCTLRHTSNLNRQVTAKFERMEDTAGKTCYEGTAVQAYKSFMIRSLEHEVMMPHLRQILHQEFNRCRTESEKKILDVLGVGSGGGDLDVKILAELQSEVPNSLIRVEIVEGSKELTDNFKDLITKTPNLEQIPIIWNVMRSEEYMSKVKATKDVKKFDFIHMIHVIYYVEDIAEAISFYHSLLKENGILVILLAARHNGQSVLWGKYQKELSNEGMKEFRSSYDIVSCLKSLGLQYEERQITNSFDITDAFDPDSKSGAEFLHLITGGMDIYQSFTPEVRDDMLNLLRTVGSTERDGKVFFNHDQACIIVHAGAEMLRL